MNNIEQAAILLLGMGEEQASQVLRHMDPLSVERLAVTMKAISVVNEEQVNQALQGFLSESEHAAGLGLGSSDYIRQTLIGALGDNKAKTLLDKTALDEKTRGLGALSWHQPASIIDFIQDEHPQTIAIVLTYLESEQAAMVLDKLPAKTRVEVIKRIATLGQISPTALEMISELLEEQTTELQHFKELPLKGARTAASIISFLDSETEKEVISELKMTDQALHAEVTGMMYSFDQLRDLEDESLRTLLNEVPSDVLMWALKACDDVFKNKCLKVMSMRDAHTLKQNMEAIGPVQLKKALTGQKAVINIAGRLASKGKIRLGQSTVMMA